MKNKIAFILALSLGLNTFGQSAFNDATIESVDELFESYVHYNRFTGSVLISQDNNIVYQRSFGYADQEGSRVNSQHSIFGIASLTKSLTAVGIMKLVEDEALTLETPISSFFPELPPNYQKQITIQHLLNHSSGIQANIGRTDDNGNGLMPEQTEITINDLFERFKDSNLNFEPGTAYDYNNFGYLLLANIIEKVSGMSYNQFMQRAVFEPAKMNSTACGFVVNPNKKAKPYLGLGMKELKSMDSFPHSSWLLGAAATNSTTVDLYKFMRALEDGDLLKSNSVEKLYTHSKDMGVNEKEYGLGWVIDQKEGEQWIYNSGILPGYASLMGSLPGKNIKIIILSNATSINPMTDDFKGKISFVDGEITDKLISILLGNSVEVLPLPSENNNPLANAGQSYQLDDRHSILFEKEDNMYFLEATGNERWSLFSYAFSRDAKENNQASKTALFFGNALSTQDFEGLSDYGNDDMRSFLNSPEGLTQLQGMWNNFQEQAGEFQSWNIYQVQGDEVKNVHIRFHFERFDIGMVLSIDSLHKIQGIFMDEAIKTSHVTKVSLVPIGSNKFFINGHQNGGMQDLKIEISDTQLTLIDAANTFIATKFRE